jgi:hypothetical protein
MVKARIATSAEQPVNRHAAVIGAEVEEGDLLGIDSATGKLVKADADSATAIPAVGVALGPSTDLSAITQDEIALVVEANRTLVDQHRLTAIGYGVEIENGDDDWDFTPGERVYLGAGGGYTQTAPATTGDLQQVVGVALTAERIMLAVSHDYTVA